MDRRLEALEQLGKLRDQNVLSQAEFEAEKLRLLERPSTIVGEDGSLASARILAFFSRRSVWIPALLIGTIALGTYLGISSTSEVFGKRPPPEEVADASQNDGTKPEPVRLSSILRFERPSECLPGDELKTLIDDMRSLEPGRGSKTVTLGVDGPSVRPEVQHVEQRDAIISRLVAPGVLEGLRVTELRTARFEGSDVETFQIRFREDSERVRRRLTDLGFEVPKIGELKTVDLEDDRGLVYGVERVPNGAALVCAWL